MVGFTILTDFLGGRHIALNKMKSTSGWKLRGVRLDFPKGDGTNESGSNGMPGGFRVNYGDYKRMDSKGIWWSSTKRILRMSLATAPPSFSNSSAMIRMPAYQPQRC